MYKDTSYSSVQIELLRWVIGNIVNMRASMVGWGDLSVFCPYS